MRAGFFHWKIGTAKRIGITGLELELYIIIGSFPKFFYGSLAFLAEETGCTRQGVHRALKRLVKRGLIRRLEKEENGHVTVVYKCEPKVNGVLTESSQGVNRGLTDNIIDNIIDKENLIKEKDGKNKFPQDREFDIMWKVLGRGDRDRARTEWEMLSPDERNKAKKHITHYVEEAKDYAVGLDRYLHNRLYDTLVYYKENGRVRYDPDAPEVDYTMEYHPKFGVYQDTNGKWWYDGLVTCSDDIRDGLTINQRPDGQKLYLSCDAWHHMEWSRKENKWIMINDKH